MGFGFVNPDILAPGNTLNLKNFILFRANVAQPGRAADL